MRAMFLGTLVACLASSAAWSDESEPSWGTSAAPAARVAQRLTLPDVTPSATFTGAQVGSGGVGLRNRITGGINVSGAPSPAKGAFLYWAVITNGAPPVATRQMNVQRRYPAPIVAANVVGTVIGTGASPCWSGNLITVYRASVPTNVASGSGLYQVTLPRAASGLANGGDPWFAAQVLPLLEGASLMIVGSGNLRVSVFDRGLAGNTFVASDGLNYNLRLPAAAGSVITQLDLVGADGQYGLNSRTAQAATSNEVTRVNGVAMGGPGSPSNDGDWNGAIAGPLPQLWDTTSHNVTAAVPGGTTVLRMAISGGNDCLTPIANIVGNR